MVEGTAGRVDAAMVKTFASEMYVRASNHSMQMSGGFGYTKDFEAQRHLRDSRIYVVGGGSSEVMRNIVARESSTTTAGGQATAAEGGLHDTEADRSARGQGRKMVEEGSCQWTWS